MKTKARLNYAACGFLFPILKIKPGASMPGVVEMGPKKIVEHPVACFLTTGVLVLLADSASEMSRRIVARLDGYGAPASPAWLKNVPPLALHDGRGTREKSFE